MLNSKKILISSLVAITGLSVVLSSSFAIFSDAQIDDTSIKTGDVNISIALSDEQEEEAYASKALSSSIITANDGTTVDAVKYTITSDGSKRAYIRAQIIPVVQNYVNGEWITATDISITDFTVYCSTGNDATTGSWVYSDGYYYYPNVVASDESFDVYIGSNVSIDNNDTTRILYDVDFEASQATHNAYAKNWGISGLPAGVEALKSSY